MIKRYFSCWICNKKREYRKGGVSLFCRDCWKQNTQEIKDFFRECRKNGEIPLSKVEHIVVNDNRFGVSRTTTNILKCVRCKKDFGYFGDCLSKKYCKNCVIEIKKERNNPKKQDLKNRIKKMIQTMKQWRI